MSRPWKVKEIDSPLVKAITRDFSLSPVTARILAARNITETGQIKRFLKRDLNDLTSPFEMDGVEPCAARIKEAIDKGENILVYGDYDVDGITATSILIRFFKVCGIGAVYFIPDRIQDGYGMTEDSVEKVLREHPDLVITVDCGIKAVKPVQLLIDKGVEVIVTDHHEAGDIRPPTRYITNPKLSPGTRFENLCAAGIAFKLAWGIAQKISGTEKVFMKFRKFLVDALSLVALGTVADIVPLLEENRVFVFQGLSVLPKQKNIKGLTSLLKVSGLSRAETLTTFDISFKLAPRINAAGRMGNASKCVKLLTTDSEEEAEKIAQELDLENRRRQVLCKATVKEAFALIRENANAATQKAIVAEKPSWHKGVIGIVASKVTEEFHRPTIILCLDNDSKTWHGSGRSVGDFHITNALEQCSQVLENFGGHRGAAGVTIQAKNLEQFKHMFESVVSKTISKEALAETFEIDAEASPAELDLKLAYEIKKLAPFGEGNRAPLLLSRGVKIGPAPRLVGSNEKHLKMRIVACPGKMVDSIGFNMGSRLHEVIDSENLDIVFSIGINTWEGNESVDLKLKDFKAVGT